MANTLFLTENCFLYKKKHQNNLQCKISNKRKVETKNNSRRFYHIQFYYSTCLLNISGVRQDSGNYSCAGINLAGLGVQSNLLWLDIQCKYFWLLILRFYRMND